MDVLTQVLVASLLLAADNYILHLGLNTIFGVEENYALFFEDIVESIRAFGEGRSVRGIER